MAGETADADLGVHDAIGGVGGAEELVELRAAEGEVGEGARGAVERAKELAGGAEHGEAALGE